MLIVDVNNLWYAAIEQHHDHHLAGVSRDELVRLLIDFARAFGEELVVVLDGPPPQGAPPDRTTRGVRRIYGAGRSADAIIVRMVHESTDPRRMTVVSSDRELTRQARLRRARIVDSETFGNRLARWLDRPRRRDGREPTAKQGGLGGTDDQIDGWLEYFQLDRDPEQHDIMGGEPAGTEPSPSGESARGERQEPDGSSSSSAGPPEKRDDTTTEFDSLMRRVLGDVTPIKRPGQGPRPGGRKGGNGS
jgi:predicted RNA-binding protein with PIN domain